MAAFNNNMLDNYAFEDMGGLFDQGSFNLQDLMNYAAPMEQPVATVMPTPEPVYQPVYQPEPAYTPEPVYMAPQPVYQAPVSQPVSAMPSIEQIINQIQAPVQDMAVEDIKPVVKQTEAKPSSSVIESLTQQILGQGTTDKWKGGVDAQTAAKDMAKIMAGIGITDINQFGKFTQGGIPTEVRPDGRGGFIDTKGNPVDPSIVKTETQSGEGGEFTYYTAPVGTQEVYGNKATGQVVPQTYGERQTGNAFGGTFEGKGNTGYRVDFTPDGKPVFYTTAASSSDALSTAKPFIQMALLAAGIGGLEALGLGAGGGAAAGGAATGATGAGLATAGEMGSLVSGLGTGTGISAGASGLGLNAAGAGLGSLGTGAGITAGAGLTGTGVLTGSSLGMGLLGTGAGLAGLTGTGILAGSELGTGLLGTTATTPLVGTGVLSGSELGSELLGTGVGSPVIAPPTPPTIIEPVTSIQPSPASSGTGITANNSGLGINAGSTGLNTIAVNGGLTNTGILTGSQLGTELLGTGTGLAGLTGTGILAGSELGTGLLGTTSTTPLVGTGVLSGSTLGTELLGTGANTAATVGGITGLTNAANVGYGALNTGVSTGLTGLGSGAVSTGINPSGASTTGIDPTTITTPATPPASTNPLSDLTPSQIANILKGAMGLFGAVGASQLGGGGGSTMGVGALPTQGIPLNSQDYFNAIQQNYNTLMPTLPRDVATPLANWYNSQYGA